MKHFEVVRQWCKKIEISFFDKWLISLDHVTIYQLKHSNQSSNTWSLLSEQNISKLRLSLIPTSLYPTISVAPTIMSYLFSHQPNVSQVNSNSFIALTFTHMPRHSDLLLDFRIEFLQPAIKLTAKTCRATIQPVHIYSSFTMNQNKTTYRSTSSSSWFSYRETVSQ